MLARHCETEGRDYDAIEKTMIGGADPVADPDGFLADDGGRTPSSASTWSTIVPPGDDPVAWTAERLRAGRAAAGRDRLTRMHTEPVNVQPVNLTEALASFDDVYSPRIVTRMNDYDVRVAHADGDHVWHVHDRHRRVLPGARRPVRHRPA